MLGETDLLEFSRDLCIEPCCITRPACDAADACNLPELDDLRTLYGTLAENTAQMVYNSQRAPRQDATAPRACIMDRLTMYAVRRISIPHEHSRALANLFTMTSAHRNDAISRVEVQALRKRLEKGPSNPEQYGKTIALLVYIETAMQRMNVDSAVLTSPSSTQRVPVAELLEVCSRYDAASTDQERLPHLFKACLFFYQLDCHAGYRWGRDYSCHVNMFRPHLHRITDMVRSLPDGCVFEKEVHFKFLRLQGRTDVCGSGRIVELKFTGQLGLTHFMQPCVYGVLDGDKYAKRCEAWNLATGEKVRVKYDNSPPNRWRLLKRLSDITGRKITVDDIELSVLPSGGFRLHSSTLRATCDLECKTEIANAVSFATSGTECVVDTP